MCRQLVKFRMILNAIMCGECLEVIESCMLVSVGEQAPGPKKSERIVEGNELKRTVLD